MISVTWSTNNSFLSHQEKNENKIEAQSSINSYLENMGRFKKPLDLKLKGCWEWLSFLRNKFLNQKILLTIFIGIQIPTEIEVKLAISILWQ